jgi:hypothetical protein
MTAVDIIRRQTESLGEEECFESSLIGPSYIAEAAHKLVVQIRKHGWFLSDINVPRRGGVIVKPQRTILRLEIQFIEWDIPRFVFGVWTAVANSKTSIRAIGRLVRFEIWFRLL